MTMRRVCPRASLATPVPLNNLLSFNELAIITHTVKHQNTRCFSRSCASMVQTGAMIWRGSGSVLCGNPFYAADTDLSAFAHNGEIPPQYTCDGRDISPPLAWSGVPTGTKERHATSWMHPDAPDPESAPRMIGGPLASLHNLPHPIATGWPEGAKQLPKGVLEGINDWKRTGYGGPYPPIGRHRYLHKLYALDAHAARSQASHRGEDRAGHERGGQPRAGRTDRSLFLHLARTEAGSLSFDLDHSRSRAASRRLYFSN